MPDLVCEECRELLAQISSNTKLINAKTDLIKQLAKQTDMARRLQTIPGVGPLTAMAIDAFTPSMGPASKMAAAYQPGLGLCRANIHLAAKNAWDASQRLGRPISDGC